MNMDGEKDPSEIEELQLGGLGTDLFTTRCMVSHFRFSSPRLKVRLP
jgi:hypothetical protein